MADETRHTLRDAADLTGCSTDKLRRWRKAGKLVCTDTDPNDPNATVYVTAGALVAAGLLSAGQSSPGESEAILGRRLAEKARDVEHDELVGLRVERIGWHRVSQLLHAHAAKSQNTIDALLAELLKGRAA
jgi:hypothetical protein